MSNACDVMLNKNVSKNVLCFFALEEPNTSVTDVRSEREKSAFKKTDIFLPGNTSEKLKRYTMQDFP